MYKLITALMLIFIGQASFAQLTDNNKVFVFVEQAPEFPGGDEAIVKFLSQNIVYPKYEQDHNIEGKVLLRFVVMEDGHVDSVTVVRGVSTNLDNEAVRVVKMLPKFKPGMQQGKAVRTFFNLPVSYHLTDSKRKQEDPQEAKKKKDPDYLNATMLAEEGYYKDAIFILIRSIRAFPDDYQSYELKADLEVKMGSKLACKTYRSAIEKGSPTAAAKLNKNCK